MGRATLLILGLLGIAALLIWAVAYPFSKHEAPKLPVPSSSPPPSNQVRPYITPEGKLKGAEQPPLPPHAANPKGSTNEE